jgi:hypothetical protein
MLATCTAWWSAGAGYFLILLLYGCPVELKEHVPLSGSEAVNQMHSSKSMKASPKLMIITVVGLNCRLDSNCYSHI